MKKFLSGLLSAALAASLLAPSAAAVGTGFTDVPAGSSLAGEVEKAVDCGLMNGYDAGTFGYGDSMTRAQFVTVLGRMMGWSDGGSHAAMRMIPEAMEVSGDLSERRISSLSSRQPSGMWWMMTSPSGPTTPSPGARCRRCWSGLWD